MDALESAWRQARASGSLGSASIGQLREHAVGFVPSAFRDQGPSVAVDIGTGAGVPGVFLALVDPDSRWLLIDSNERCCGYASAAVAALGLSARVEVHHGRVEDLAHDATWRGTVDLVVSRLFGEPAEVAECAIPLLRVGGRLVVSSSVGSEARWASADLSVFGAELTSNWETAAGRYLSVVRWADSDVGYYPRRTAARRRNPLF